MPYFVFWILLLFLIPGSHIYSQEKWTLDKCISHAEEYNIHLKQQELTINIAENKLLESKLQLLPAIDAGASQIFRFGRSVDPLTYEFTTENNKGSSLYGSTSVDLFTGFRSINAVKRNNLNLEISLQDYEKARNDLALNITRFYLQILFNKELLEIANQQVEMTGLQVENIRTLVDAGSLPGGALLEMQAHLAREELIMGKTSNQLRLSLLDLAQLLDLESYEDFDIVSPSFSTVEVEDFLGSANEIYQSSLELMPQVKSAELLVQFQERSLAISKGLLSPSLAMSASWGSGYSDNIIDYQTGNIMAFRDQIEFARTTSLEFNFRVPIFDNWSNQTAIKNSKIALKNSYYRLQQVKNQLSKEIQQALADAQAAYEKYRATEKSLIYLKEAFRYSEDKFNSGLLTSLDYNVAKTNLSKAQSDLLQAKYQYIFNLGILDFYRGIPIELK